MKIEREVVQDLLPLYLEGEVSPATRRLVEECLAQDPELQKLVQSSQSKRDVPQVPLRTEPVLRVLEQTKRQLNRQKWLQFFALLLTITPFTFVVQGGELQFFLLRDAPAVLLPLWGGAVVCWLFYWRLRRGLQ
jgi:anti-sigma factor RsiW